MLCCMLIKEENMPKKQQITLENIQSIPHDDLAELVYSQMDDHSTLHDKVEKVLLRSNPTALLKSINKDIASIKRGRKFIGYYEAFDFAQKVSGIVDDIVVMVDDSKVASVLLKELILTDSKVYLRADDSNGFIQESYARAEDAWAECLDALDDEQIYDDILEMLVCEGFGVREVFSEYVPKSVLERIYAEFEKKCSANMGNDLDNEFDDIQVLQSCAHYLKKPELYIKAIKMNRQELHATDYLDFAKEYTYAGDMQGTLDMLKKMVFVDGYKANEYYELEVNAYESLGQSMDVTLAYKNWYTKTKSPEVLKKYLARLDGVVKKQAKAVALQDAQKLSFSEAMYFFQSLEEPELASQYIWEHRDALATQHVQGNNLKKIATWLKGDYPQEVILLYRDSCERALATSQSKHYPSAIKSLKECLKIEKENDTLSWEIDENMNYMEKLINTHRKKPKFVELFFKAFGDT